MSAFDLPTELLRKILGHAVYVAFLLNNEWDYDPDNIPWQTWRIGETEHVQLFSTQTRQSIVQVCRRWRDIGVELLYEFIIIPQLVVRRPETLHKLVSLLAESNTANDKGYGWWIKRIDVPGACLRDEEAFTSVIALLEHCHNLQVFTVGREESSTAHVVVRHSVRSRLSDVLENRFSHSLRRLAFEVIWSTEGTAERHAILPAIPLSTLDVILWGDPPSPRALMALNTITSLTIVWGITKLDGWVFPRLQHLGLVESGWFRMRHLRPFLKRHEHTLESLSVFTSDSSNVNLAPLITGIIGGLKVLSLREHDLRNFRSNALLRGIRHLGVADVHDGVHGMFRVVTKGMCPELQTLCLIHKPGSSPYLQLHLEVHSKLIEACRARNIRLVDSRDRI